MQKTILFLWLVYSMPAFAQSAQEQKIIADFKNDFLHNVRILQHDTLRLPPYTFERVAFSWKRLIKTFEDNNKVVLHEYYYPESTQLMSSETYTLSGVPIGVTKTYAKDGTLNYILDYDKGEWTVYNQTAYPFYDLQTKLKLKADSLVAKLYGPDLLRENLTWNVTESYMYNKSQSGRWTDGFTIQPTTFLITYNAKLDNQHIYYNVLRLRLDVQGNVIPDSLRTYLDCTEGQINWKGGFKLSYQQALRECTKRGLVESETTPLMDELKWENFGNSTEIPEQFRFYITARTKVLEDLQPQGRSSRTTKYERYYFDPLSGNFLEKKKLKIFEYWSGKNENYGTSGFFPDDE